MHVQNVAAIIGIDHYESDPLEGCQADARALQSAIASNDDGSLNFVSETLLSSDLRVTKAAVVSAYRSVFSNKDARIALFYFAGHGSLTSDGGFLVTQDATENDEGVPMAQLINAANASQATERIIILDCCHAGSIDQLFGSSRSIPIERGVSILAGCRADQQALETRGRGNFTRLICEALAGGAADLRGAVNVASLYSYVDEVTAIGKPRPLFKANISKLVSIRMAGAAIPESKLRKLAEYFPTEVGVYPLDPSYEPTMGLNNKTNELIFGDLQRFRAARLVVPNDEEHMYYAAINNRSCSLTPLGRFYWKQYSS